MFNISLQIAGSCGFNVNHFRLFHNYSLTVSHYHRVFSAREYVFNNLSRATVISCETLLSEGSSLLKIPFFTSLQAAQHSHYMMFPVLLSSLSFTLSCLSFR